MRAACAVLSLFISAGAGAQVVEYSAEAPPAPPPVITRVLPEQHGAARAPGVGVEAMPLYSIGQPTDEEQYYLELINRARASPTAEGVRLAGTTDPDVLSSLGAFSVNLALMQNEFTLLPVRPPLAMNEQLINAARAHTQDMLTNAFQGHDSTNGDDLGDRADDAGYPFLALGENVFSYAESAFHGHAGFQVDWGTGPGGMQPGRGHRVNIHGAFREIGVGVINGTNTVGGETVGPQLVTQDFGSSNSGTAFVTGVAFYDLDGNGIYGVGEGIGGISVTVAGAGHQAVTANSGGYTIPVPVTEANRAVTFTGVGFNGNGTAAITGGNNAKVDFAPVYSAPVVTGPTVVSSGNASNYTFSSTAGATGYRWRRAVPAIPAVDTAANLNRVGVQKTGVYNVLSGGMFRLAHPSAPVDQILTYNATFRVGTGGAVNFQSRLAFAGTGEMARVQISTNGGLNWTDGYSQTGTGGAGEGSLVNRTVSLAAFVGREVRVRFLYRFGSGTFFPEGTGVGWFLDNITFTNLTELTDPVFTDAAPGDSFQFTPPSAGTFELAVRPTISGRAMPYGPALVVTATEGPPPPPEISLQLAPGTALTDGVSTVNFGSAVLGTAHVRTFTIMNAGGENLTGLSVNVVGADAAVFVAGAPGVATLGGGQSTSFNVSFTPDALGARGATLRVVSNDTDENPFDVTLTGTGIPPPPEIAIEQAGANLTDGAITVAFGTVTLGLPVMRTFTIRNLGPGVLNALAVSVIGANAAEFSAGAPGAVTLNPNESTTFDVIFTPTVAGNRAASLSVASNDSNENPFDVALTGVGDAKPVVSAPAPAAAMRLAGGAATTFSVTAAPLPVTYQWRKNGASIAGAVGASLTINTPKLTDAGAYTVLVKKGTLSTPSAAGQLGVAENVPKTLVMPENGTAAIGINTAGTGLLYLWKRAGAALPAEARIKGAATKALSVGQLKVSDSGVYTCEVSLPGGGMVVGGTTELRVFNSKPVIVSFDPPDGIVGGTYTYALEMSALPTEAATSYAATGLPAGLKMDAKTGLISGKPTKAGPFSITCTATNAKGKATSAPAVGVIATLPPDVAGVWIGRVERSPLNNNMGGRIDLTVTATGSFTGKLTMGMLSYPLTGVLEIDVNPLGQPPTLDLDLKRAGTPLPAPLHLHLEMQSNRLIQPDSQVSADGEIALGSGWRQVWHTTANPAASFLGLHTLLLELAGAEGAAVPQGTGYATFTVAKDGKLTLAGKTADGEAISVAGFLSPAGEIVVFQPLYTTNPKGSLLGQLDIDIDAMNFANNSLDGALDWVRPANALASARTYKAGFGAPVPIALSARGGRYTGAAAVLILGVINGADNARLTFSAGGVAASSDNPGTVIFDVKTGNKLTLPPLGVENPGGAKLTVTPASGAFTGTFTLTDPNPLNAAQVITRSVAYQGMMIKVSGQHLGGGYFLVPQLPSAGPPPTTSTTSPILSGKVLLEPHP